MLAGYVDGNLAENELGRKRRGGGRILNFEGKMGRADRARSADFGP